MEEWLFQKMTKWQQEKDKSTRRRITKRNDNIRMFELWSQVSKQWSRIENTDISHIYFRINWNCPKCNTEGLTTFINNKKEDMK